MTSKEKELLHVFNKVFKTDLNRLDISRLEFPQWDSMKHVELIIALQKKTGQKFNMADILKIEKLSDFLALLP